jgi:hypothetical protein
MLAPGDQELQARQARFVVRVVFVISHPLRSKDNPAAVIVERLNALSSIG